MSAQYAKDMASLANIIETSNGCCAAGAFAYGPVRVLTQGVRIAGRNLAARTQARVHEEIVRKHVNEQTLRFVARDPRACVRPEQR
jgi:hypothetical protein